jgi:uncharacterized DUF497 family protein
VRYEWDEAKRQQNVAKHEVDFRVAASIFAGPVLETEDTRRDYGERRWRAIGAHAGAVYVVVFTRRHDARRLISAWRAGHEDEARYQELLARGPEGHAGPGAWAGTLMPRRARRSPSASGSGPAW